MDPIFAAGVLAAAYDLGLTSKPSVAAQKAAAGGGFDSHAHTAELSGLLGYALGSHQAKDVIERNEYLEAALNRLATLRVQEQMASQMREAELKKALLESEQNRHILEVARRAQIASDIHGHGSKASF